MTLSFFFCKILYQTEEKFNRNCNIIWLKQPYNKNVKTNIFIQLIDKHLPNQSKPHEIFNRNTQKLSYSCTKIILQITRKQEKSPVHNRLPLHPSVTTECSTNVHPTISAYKIM